MGALDNLFGQMSDVGTTLSGLGDNTPLGIPNPVGAPGNPLAAVQPPASQQTTTPDTEDAMEMFQRLVAENEPLLRASRNAALKTPKEREEEIYKQKIQQMFGVKLGEKNPKWRSALRGITEGLDSLAAGYNRTPTIREKARRQAQEDYKLENEVLGKDSTATLARMGQAAQQANMAGIAKMKVEASKLAQQAKLDAAKDPNNPKVQEIYAKIAESATRGDLNAAKILKTQLDGELVKKKTEIADKTPEMLTAEGINKDPSLGAGIGMLGYLRAGSTEAGKAAAGGGQGRSSTHVGTEKVPNFFTGQMEIIPKVSTTSSGPTKNPDAAASFMKTLDAMRQKAGSPQAQPAAAGQSEGVAPPAAPAVPRQIVATPQGVRPAPVAPQQPVTQLPEDMSLPKLGNGTAGTRAKTALGAVEANFRKNGHLIKSVGETYLKLKDAATMTANLTDSVVNAALNFQPGKNQSDLEQYSGARGIFNATKDTLRDKKLTAPGLSAVEIDTAANDLRHKITGAGAGYKELAMLRRNFPETPGSFSIQGHHTSLQKALILHFISQKVLWNNSHNIGNPEVFQNHFNEKLVSDRIDSILNDYREYEKRVQAAPQNKRAALQEALQNSINEKLDAQTMFESDWRNSQGIPSTAPGGKNKPRVIVIKPKR